MAIEERFADLANPDLQDYPGRTKPVMRRARQPKELPVWDERPLHYRVNGVRREFFTIGHLARALSYSVQSIRAWEGQGLLPKSPFRSPKPYTPTLGGRNTKGKRLWTREQIEGIVRIAQEEKVILNKVPPTKRFAAKVAEMFREIQANYQ